MEAESRRLKLRSELIRCHLFDLSLPGLYYLKWSLLIVPSLYLPFHSLQRYLKDQNWDLNEAHADGVMIGHSWVALS